MNVNLKNARNFMILVLTMSNFACTQSTSVNSGKAASESSKSPTASAKKPTAAAKTVSGFGVVTGGGISTGPGVTVIATVGEPMGQTAIDTSLQSASGLKVIPNLKGPLNQE